MQDATAQMALLQFMQAGKQKAATIIVHADHLIQARIGADKDLQEAINKNNEVYNFQVQFAANTALDFGNQVQV